MSMIRTVSYKASIQSDGSIYNESIEYGVEMDSMPLAQSQLDDAGARIDQLRQAILAKRKQWEGAPEQPKEQGQATVDGSKPAAPPAAAPVPPKAGAVKCIRCGTPVEPKVSQKGVEYSYCPKCKDNRRKDGTEFPKKEG